MWCTFRNKIGVRACLRICEASAGLSIQTCTFPRSFFSPHMVSLSCAGGSSWTLPRTTALLPLAFVPTNVRGPDCSWYTAFSKDHLLLHASSFTLTISSWSQELKANLTLPVSEFELCHTCSHRFDLGLCYGRSDWQIHNVVSQGRRWLGVLLKHCEQEPVIRCYFLMGMF